MQDRIKVFYGEDAFYIRSRVNQLIKKWDVDDFNVTSYDCEETPVSEAINDAMTIPFMSEGKVVIARNADFLSTQKAKSPSVEHSEEALRQYIENPSGHTLFILTVPKEKLDMRSKTVKLLKEHAEVVECRLKRSRDLLAWVKRQLANANLHIESDALDELMKRIHSSTEMAYSELKKLLLYTEGESTVDKAMIERVITKNIEHNVYELTNALLARDHKRAVEIYHDLITYSEDPLRVLSVVVGKYREMLQVKTLLDQGYTQDDIQWHFNVKSGRAYYMVQNARVVPRDKIEDHLTQLEHLDYAIKSGRLEKRMALELFIMNV